MAKRLAAAFLAQSFKYKNIVIASMIFTFSNVISLYFINWLWFKEPLSITKTFGIVMGIVSIIIMEF